jgi:hypothetical protein
MTPPALANAPEGIALRDVPLAFGLRIRVRHLPASRSRLVERMSSGRKLQKPGSRSCGRGV